MDQTSKTAGPDDRNEDNAALTATVLTAVERQLTRYFSAMTQRVDESIAAAERLRAEVDDRLTSHQSAVESHRAATEAYQQALQRAIDERLAEIAAHHAARLSEFDARLTVIAAQPAGVSPEDLLQIRQAMREDIWRSLGPITERLDALADANRRTDDQAAALVEHVNTTTTTLITRIDDGDQLIALAAEERLAEARAQLSSRIEEVHVAANDRADAADTRLTASEAAAVAATARMAELEHRVGTMNLELATLATKVGGIDQEAIEDLKTQMSAAIGESMLVRIELDRIVATNEEKLDKTAVRLGEIEALLTDEMDVGAAVQLERLDELERAVMFLDPDQFVRKDELLTGSSDSPINPRSDDADISVHEQVLHDDSFMAESSHGSSYDDAFSSDAHSDSEAWS